jgi:hypothetical protein
VRTLAVACVYSRCRIIRADVSRAGQNGPGWRCRLLMRNSHWQVTKWHPFSAPGSHGENGCNDSVRFKQGPGFSVGEPKHEVVVIGAFGQLPVHFGREGWRRGFGVGEEPPSGASLKELHRLSSPQGIIPTPSPPPEISTATGGETSFCPRRNSTGGRYKISWSEAPADPQRRLARASRRDQYGNGLPLYRHCGL